MNLEDEIVTKLEYYLTNFVRVDASGQPTFALLEHKQGTVYPNLQLHVHSDEHNPPHFHVRCSAKNINISIRIDNGELINGIPLPSKQMQAIECWRLENLDTLNNKFREYNKHLPQR